MKLLLPDLRLVGITAATALAASLMLALSAAPAMMVDGQHVATDVAPVTTASGTYLPIRAVGDASGAETTYDRAAGTIAVRRGADRLVMHVGSTAAVFNGEAVTLVHAPFVVQGRAMVASATVTRAFGTTVRYDRKHARVEVRSPGVVVAGAPDDEL